MATPPKNGKLLYHLTSVDNLENIFSNGLLSRHALQTFVDVADAAIIDRRIEKDLNNFVPFHFFAGTPFAGAVQRKHRDKDFVFITVTRTIAEKNNFKILTQHPLSLNNCEPLSYSDGFEIMDWDTMARREYADHDCCEICMAECLSPATVSTANFFCVYTKNDSIRKHVVTLRDKVIGYKTFDVIVNKYLFIP